MNLNKVFIGGNLTRDPEMRALPSGGNVCSFTIATNRTYSKDGERKDDTEFHNIVTFGKLADTCAQYLKKAQFALVEGRIQTRNWEVDGVRQHKTEIVADGVQFGKNN